MKTPSGESIFDWLDRECPDLPLGPPFSPVRHDLADAIVRLLTEESEAGVYSVTWDAREHLGKIFDVVTEILDESQRTKLMALVVELDTLLTKAPGGDKDHYPLEQR
jgi:hypothetical protein